MEGTDPLVYSYTEGSLIAAKLNHTENNVDYIRMGISFPLDREKYSSTFKPSEDYVAYEVLNSLLELSDIVDEEREFTIRKTNVCYGNSLSMTDKKRGKDIVGMFVMNEPLNDSSLSLKGLSRVCDSLSRNYQEVSFYKDTGTYLNAVMNSSPLAEKFSSQITMLDIKTPKETLGCRLEFILPKEQYEIERIERQFNDVAQFVGFGKKLSELEKLHKEFVELKDRYTDKQKVVMKVKV